MTTVALSVGDPRRRSIGRATFLSLLSAIVFLAVAVAVKDVRSLSASAPWSEDPYDAFFSFAIFFVALVAALSLIRSPLCRRARRGADSHRPDRAIPRPGHTPIGVDRRPMGVPRPGMCT